MCKRAAAPAAGASKRSKKQYSQAAGGSSSGAELARGMRGVLITCDPHVEKKAIRECIGLLSDLHERDTTNAAGEDAAADAGSTAGSALAAELAALQEEGGKPDARAFSAVRSGCAGNVMIRFAASAAAEPVQLVDRAMERAAATGISCAPHVVRMLPVQATCAAQPKAIVAAATPLLAALRGSEGSYAVQWKRRCNSGVDKMEVINGLAAAVLELAPKARVDLTRPDTALLVEVLRTVCCVSVLPAWVRHQGYNLRSVAGYVAPVREGGRKESAQFNGAQ